MKIYISGPMSNYPDNNIPAFNAEAARLRALGHTVFNPAEHQRNGWTWEDYLCFDLSIIIREPFDALAMLPGWRGSKGARIEFETAKALGIKIIPAEEFV